MEPIALTLALVLVALLRRPGNFSPALVLEGKSRCEGPETSGDEEEDEEMPETDRSPSPRQLPWLPWAVAAVGVVRVTLLVTLHG
jgi:hypothetical protein